jgi:hypothetical protein
MKALLDAHTFLWAISDDERLSRRAQKTFTGPNELWLSVASGLKNFLHPYRFSSMPTLSRRASVVKNV